MVWMDGMDAVSVWAGSRQLPPAIGPMLFLFLAVVAPGAAERQLAQTLEKSQIDVQVGSDAIKKGSMVQSSLEQGRYE